MAINETVKLIIALVIGCLLFYFGQTVLDWREGAQQNEQRGRTMQATTDIAKDGAKADEQRLFIDVGLLEARARFNQQLEEDKANEPEVAERADRTVPSSRLRAFRERRLARERLGCAGEQCQSRSTEANAPER